MAHILVVDDELSVLAKTVSKHFDVCINSSVITEEVIAPYLKQEYSCDNAFGKRRGV